MENPKKEASPFVFLDPSGKRWPRLRLALLLLIFVVFIAIVWFIEALLVRPELRLPASVRKLKGQLKESVQRTDALPIDPAKIAPWQKFYPKSPAAVQRIVKLREQLHGLQQKKISRRSGHQRLQKSTKAYCANGGAICFFCIMHLRLSTQLHL